MTRSDVPLVSVIVLNFNGRHFLGACLDALMAQVRAPSFEVLIYDNASTDGSDRYVQQQYPQVRFVRSERNRGFAGGNNAAARAARGRFLVFLNNDTAAAPDWLQRLHGGLADHREAALVASRIVFMDDPDVIDSAGDGYLRAGGAFKHGHGEPASAFDRSREVFGACGAAFMVRREVFEALGGFDERFFMVYEDVDFAYRARLAGHRCWYAADAIVRHAGSGTLGPASAAAVFFGQRNLEWTWLKNTPWPLVLRMGPAHVVYSLAGVLHYLRAGRGGPALRGKLAALIGAPAMIRHRRVVQRQRRVTLRELMAVQDRAWLRRKRREKSERLHLANHQQRPSG